MADGESELGRLIVRFERDDDEANRNTSMSVIIIVAGAAGVLLGALRIIRNQSSGMTLVIAGGFAFWVGLILLRGTKLTLESIEFCEDGIRWNDARYPSTMRWDEIEYIEVVRSKEEDQVHSLFLCNGDDSGQMISKGWIKQFDELIEQIDSLAKDRGISFRRA